MIKQHNIAITQKYNFPKNIIEQTLPERLFEQSLYSLNWLNNQQFQSDNSIHSEFFNENNFPSRLHIKNKAISLGPLNIKTNIGAVDTSTIKIGETKKGTLFAIRGAISQKQNKKYKYTRIGPFVFHITEKNKNQIFYELEKSFFKKYKKPYLNKFNLLQIPTHIAFLLERWLQNSLTQEIKNGIILFDGSLTSGITDSSVGYLKNILRIAKEKNNTILAFSKITKLRSNGYLITEKLPKHDPPYILETSGMSSKFPFINLGDIYVAKLAKSKYAFRLDIDKEIPFKNRKNAIEKLIGNDFLTHGYPETLRLAHVLCTFTANEIIALKHFLNSKHKIRIINRPDMHKILFGPFGKGEN
jgi:hypothetical protein